MSYLQNFRFQFLIIRKLDQFFTKSVDFKHVSIATKEIGNPSFALFCYFWLRFTKCVKPAKFQIPVPHNKEVRPIFLPNLWILNTFPWQRKKVKICVLFYFAIFGYDLSSLTYLQNFRPIFSRFTKLDSFKHFFPINFMKITKIVIF